MLPLGGWSEIISRSHFTQSANDNRIMVLINRTITDPYYLYLRHIDHGWVPRTSRVPRIFESYCKPIHVFMVKLEHVSHFVKCNCSNIQFFLSFVICSINFWMHSIIIKLLPCLVLTVISFILIRVLCQAAKRKVKLKGYNQPAASTTTAAIGAGGNGTGTAASASTALNGHRWIV